MAAHDDNTGLLAELLALGNRDGSCQLELRITCRNSCRRHILSIDEHTYLQIAALGPLSGYKVRLSLYMKWDPFRRTYFSSLIRIRDNFSETLYFNCSESYGRQLFELKEQEYAPSLQADRQEAAADARTMPVISEYKQAAMPGTRYKRTVLLRGLMFGFLLVLLLLRMGTGETWLFANSVEARQDHKNADTASSAVSAADTERAAGTAIAAADPDPDRVHNVSEAPEAISPDGLKLVPLSGGTAQAAPVPAGLPAQPRALYETIELSGDSYTYSLPEGYVSLTFDDGPSSYTEQLVDILVKEGIAANFLFIGVNASRNPGAVRYADEHGMPVGSHSWDHSDMTANSAEENRINLERASRSLEQLTAAPVTIFRPPYGAVNSGLAEVADRQQLNILLWNRDPEDWKASGPKDILDYFKKSEPSGGIYLLHEKQKTLQALPEIIAHLKGQGLKFAVFE